MAKKKIIKTTGSRKTGIVTKKKTGKTTGKDKTGTVARKTSRKESGTTNSVSVISVNLNHKAELEHTLKSIHEQDYAEIQHVIVDGGSTDGSIELIKEYAKKYEIEWISEPDKGIYDAMNKGVQLANGNWINFLNAGDSFASSQTVSDVIKNTESGDDLVYGHTCFVSADKKQIIKGRGTEILWQALNFNHNSLFTRREILLKHPFNLFYRIVADSEFVVWCYKQEYHFKCLDMVINNYPVGGFADSNSILRTVERWKLVSDYELESQIKINRFYFLRLLWENFYKRFLNELGFRKVKQ